MSNTIDLSAFLRENIKDAGTVKYAASKRILNPKTKEPVQWEIKAISNEQNEAIQKECMTGNRDKRGRITTQMDGELYALKLCVACTVFPPLNDAGLQDNHGVMGAENLLKDLLNPGELLAYKDKVMEVNGFDMTMDDLVDEAKN